jgi:hypothetical protein
MYNTLAGFNTSKVLDDNETFTVPLNDDMNQSLTTFNTSRISLNTTGNNTYWGPNYSGFELEKNERKIEIDDSFSELSNETIEEDVCEFGI